MTTIFAAGISRDWDALRTKQPFSLQNRVIQSVYPPGSVWKAGCGRHAAGAWRQPGGKRELLRRSRWATRYSAAGSAALRGAQDMQNALINSCDVYFYQMGERMGIDKLEEFAKASGFGRPHRH